MRSHMPIVTIDITESVALDKRTPLNEDDQFIKNNTLNKRYLLRREKGIHLGVIDLVGVIGVRVQN